MKFKFLKKTRNRLFKKIFLLFISSLIITISFLIFSHRFFFLSKRFPKILRNSVNHVELLIKEIGKPFNIKKAEKICKGLEIQIRFISPGFKWASGKSIESVKTKNLHMFEKRSDIRVGFTERGPAIAVRKKEGTFLFILHSERENFRTTATLFLLSFILFISIIITGMYFIIKKILKPVKVLERGVKEIGSGNIGYTMKPSGNDELGKLIVSFNSMSSEIGKMIKAKDQLLLDVSHELRSPLTRIKVALEFLENSEAKNSIMDDINEIEKMVNELLETERLKSPYGSLKKESIDLNSFLGEIITGMKNEKPGIKFIRKENNSYIIADPERLGILFKNIIGNALKFSKDQKDPVEISVYKTGKMSTVKITDHGPGIPEEEVGNIFEPFYRIDKSRSKDTGGYGLGMSLSKKIIEAHSGKIDLESSPGKGTTVYLRFKISD